MLFLSVPAYLAIGVHFLFWHSLRHLARWSRLEERRRPRTISPRRSVMDRVVRLVRDTWLGTLGALLMLAAATGWASSGVSDTETFAALYLVLISALTIPHALVMLLLDR